MGIGLLIVLCYILVWALFGLVRNNRVYNIRIKWINTTDKRHDKYTYDSMLKINRKNWFGWKLPKDSDFS